MDHIVDALLAAVMSKPALEPLGPEYGSSILHLIEAYGAAKKEASKAQNELSQAAERRQKENDDFDTLVTDWTIHEARYKAEIKRLEVIIHRTSGSGLEAVSMARSGSLIRRGSRNVTGDQNISPTDLGNHRRGTTDRGVFKTEASATRHRDSLIGRPRILDPKSDVTLSMKIDKEPLVDNVTSIIQTHATIREVPSTPSSKSSSSSSSSGIHGSTKRSSGPALERAQILSGSPSFAAEKQRHQREFSFAEGEDSNMVTQDEVDISVTHSRNENATVKSPHTPLGSRKKDEEQCITYTCTTAPGAGEVPLDGMKDGLPQLRRSKETAQRRFGGKIDADGKAYL
ncbi:unnamed protein product [Clonostachys solani]|uniref:Uncharacterized protein n=1 Tax=Clonostachys solani TaxID=160281 RepID=A0A9N9W2G6_9HYPO|nr:unnamed protein product [Clonostachys solani]